MGDQDLIRETLIEIAHEAMAGRKDVSWRERGYTFHHGLRVGRIAVTLAGTLDEPVDVAGTILFAGGLFHDVAKSDPKHQESGARVVRELLAGAAGPEDIEAISQLVLHHNDRGHDSGCTVAQRVVQDADVLDHFGAQNIWLSFHYNAAHEEGPSQCLEYFRSDKHRRFVKQARAGLNFDASRCAMDRRLGIEREFLVRFAQENEGAL